MSPEERQQLLNALAPKLKPEELIVAQKAGEELAQMTNKHIVLSYQLHQTYSREEIMAASEKVAQESFYKLPTDATERLELLRAGALTFPTDDLEE